MPAAWRLRPLPLALILVALASFLPGAAPIADGQRLAPAALLPASLPAAPGEVLAAFTTPAPPAPATLRTLGLSLIEHYPRSGVTRLRTADGDVPAALTRLHDAGLVRFAEPNQRLRLAGVIPNDPRYADQAPYWDLLGAPAAWDVTTGSPTVVVALLDGAVDLDHPDLAGNIWTNAGEIPANGLDDDGNGYIDDVHGFDFVGDFAGDPHGVPGQDADPDVRPGDAAAGDGRDQDHDGVADGAVGHGTRVAGIIAARGNDGLGIAGAAWRVRIMPVRVTDPEGTGFSSSLIRALEYAVANRAGIVNISLTAPFFPQAAEAAIAAAHAAGVVIVAAAGNSGLGVAFPAALPQVIAVGAHGPLEDPAARPPFSPRQSGVDLVAPGIAVLTTDVLPGSALPSYATVTGTSFASPFVTGAVALMQSLDPAAGADHIRALLRRTATPLPNDAWPGWAGAGRLNLGLALETLAAEPPLPPAIDAIDPAGDGYRIHGRARVDSAVTLTRPPAGPLGVTAADADGAYSLRIPRTTVPETQPLLTVVAVARAPTGDSAPSPPRTLSLPRLVTLFPGWNLVAWAGATGPGADVLGGLPLAVDRVFAWDGRNWRIHVSGNPAFRIPVISAGAGLWLYLDGPHPVDWRQDRAPIDPARLSRGWHLRAWSGPTASAADVAGVPGLRIDALFAWDPIAAAHRSFFPRAPAVGSLTRVTHLQALWVFVGAGRGAWPGP